MKIAIIGAGHMGSWLAKTLSNINKVGDLNVSEVSVFDINKDVLKPLAGLNKIKILQNTSELKSLNPDLLINAVSIRKTKEVYSDVIQYLDKSKCILCDVTSVKGDIVEYYKNSGFKFASIHPMFGPTFANINALKEENAIIIKESEDVIKKLFWDLFKTLELNIFEFSFAEHDQMVAYSLTLPFASSMVFASCMKTVTVPGTTFKRHLNIAKGLLSEDDYLLADIMFNEYSLEQLEKVTNRLEFLKHIIKGKDYDEACKFFEKLRGNIK